MALLTALPWPVRLIFFALIGVLAAKLLQGMGWLLALAAVGLWSLVILVVLQATRVESGFAPMPRLGPFLTWLGGNAFVAAPAPMGMPAFRQSDTPSPSAGNDRERRLDEALAALGQLRGIPLVTQTINRLMDMAEDAQQRGRRGFGTNAPATLLALTGGPGTGKTTVAHLLAPLFYGQKILERPFVKTVSGQDLAGSFTTQASQAAQQAAEDALGGLLLLDDADWLCQSRPLGDTPGLDGAHAIMRVASAHPGRLLIVMTLSKSGLPKLLNDAQHHAAWLGKLLVEEIPFPDQLSETDLSELLEEQFASYELEIASEARPALRSQIKSLQRTSSPVFDNATAMRRLAERVQRQVRNRLREEGNDVPRLCVTAADVRAIEE